MEKQRKISTGRYVRFGLVLAVYLACVIWVGNYWWLLGVPIIVDIYITKKVHWFFWRKRGVKKQKAWIEWLDALLFAVVMATLIRLLFIEAYTIPTGSMENTLRVGDYLFVSKVAYGPKMPETPLSLPLVHNTLPFTKSTPSYVEWIKSKYHRLAGFGDVERNDIVVFRFPEGDTIVRAYPDQSYYYICREIGRSATNQRFELLVRPVDKRENYVKRCVAIAGDTLQVKEGVAYINGQLEKKIPGIQYNYALKTTGAPFSERLIEKYDISANDAIWNPYTLEETVPLTEAAYEQIKQLPIIVSSKRALSNPLGMADIQIFPHDTVNFHWTVENFGPIWVPKRGATVELTLKNLPLYHRIIETYEGHDLQIKDGSIYIDGEEAKSYTFDMDYFFMMGDNRNFSLDSRYWGFVPEDHVVGKAAFVWLSLDPNKPFPSNIRWSHMFHRVR